jgi:hypothetical protein
MIAILRGKRTGAREPQMARIRRTAYRDSSGIQDAIRWSSEPLWKYGKRRPQRPRCPRISHDLPPWRRKCWRGQRRTESLR